MTVGHGPAKLLCVFQGQDPATTWAWAASCCEAVRSVEETAETHQGKANMLIRIYETADCVVKLFNSIFQQCFPFQDFWWSTQWILWSSLFASIFWRAMALLLVLSFMKGNITMSRYFNHGAVAWTSVTAWLQLVAWQEIQNARHPGG